MDGANKSPAIVAFVADLYFISRIEQTAAGLGFDVHWIEKAESIDEHHFTPPERQYAEHLVGPGAELIEMLTSLHPGLIIFDLNNTFVPWRRWIALIKSAPATRRLPVLCFGSHKDVQAFQTAKSAGADAVVARSRFTTDLPGLINKYARIIDLEALSRSCAAPLAHLAVKGLEEFNQGEYFEAHETLETAWNEDSTPGRELYRAVLQISVAYLQITRGNYAGAIKMFLRVRQWIDPLPDFCRGINVAKLRADAYRVYQELKDLGPEGISSFDHRLLKPVEYHINNDQ